MRLLVLFLVLLILLVPDFDLQAQSPQDCPAPGWEPDNRMLLDPLWSQRCRHCFGERPIATSFREPTSTPTPTIDPLTPTLTPSPTLSPDDALEGIGWAYEIFDGVTREDIYVYSLADVYLDIGEHLQIQLPDPSVLTGGTAESFLPVAFSWIISYRPDVVDHAVAEAEFQLRHPLLTFSSGIWAAGTSGVSYEGCADVEIYEGSYNSLCDGVLSSSFWHQASDAEYPDDYVQCCAYHYHMGRYDSAAVMDVGFIPGNPGGVMLNDDPWWRLQLVLLVDIDYMGGQILSTPTSTPTSTLTEDPEATSTPTPTDVPPCDLAYVDLESLTYPTYRDSFGVMQGIYYTFIPPPGLRLLATLVEDQRKDYIYGNAGFYTVQSGDPHGGYRRWYDGVYLYPSRFLILAEDSDVLEDAVREFLLRPIVSNVTTTTLSSPPALNEVTFARAGISSGNNIEVGETALTVIAVYGRDSCEPPPLAPTFTPTSTPTGTPTFVSTFTPTSTPTPEATSTPFGGSGYCSVPQWLNTPTSTPTPYGDFDPMGTIDAFQATMTALVPSTITPTPQCLNPPCQFSTLGPTRDVTGTAAVLNPEHTATRSSIDVAHTATLQALQATATWVPLATQTQVLQDYDDFNAATSTSAAMTATAWYDEYAPTSSAATATAAMVQTQIAGETGPNAIYTQSGATLQAQLTQNAPGYGGIGGAGTGSGGDGFRDEFHPDGTGPRGGSDYGSGLGGDLALPNTPGFSLDLDGDNRRRVGDCNELVPRFSVPGTDVGTPRIVMCVEWVEIPSFNLFGVTIPAGLLLFPVWAGLMRFIFKM